MFASNQTSFGLFLGLVAGIGLVASAAVCTDGDDPSADPASRVGGISGTLAYPGDDPAGGPAQVVVAFNADSDEPYWVNVAKAGAYTLKELPPGAYRVVAYASGRSAGYSEAVDCGLGVSCSDHRLVDIVVKAGEVTPGVDPIDWYAPDGAFPDMPAEIIVPDDGPGVPEDCRASAEGCELAAQLEHWAREEQHEGFAQMIDGGAQQTFVCDGYGGDFRLYPLCDGAAAGEERRGFPRAVHGSEGGAVNADEFKRAVSAYIEAGATLRSTACGVGDAECDRFVAAFGAAEGQPRAFYLAFERDAYAGAYFVVGFGVSGDNADTILDGGTTFTVAGEVTFVPWVGAGTKQAD